jgi:hypothetical protein
VSGEVFGSDHNEYGPGGKPSYTVGISARACNVRGAAFTAVNARAYAMRLVKSDRFEIFDRQASGNRGRARYPQGESENVITSRRDSATVS